MRKLMICFALLLAVGVTIGTTPARAVIYLPCDQICEGMPGSTKCSCPAGTPLEGRNVTCSHTDWDCFYID